jgi:hypothetical protein
MKLAKAFVITSLLSLPAAAAEADLIMGLRTDAKKVIFQVKSGGCTEKKHFDLRSTKSGGHTEFTLVRIEEDHCKMIVDGGQDIVYTLDELGIKFGETFTVTNPIAFWNEF